MNKNKAAQSLQKLSFKKQKSDPDYFKKMKERSDKGKEARKKQAIARAVDYLVKNGYRVVGNIISAPPAKKN